VSSSSDDRTPNRAPVGGRPFSDAGESLLRVTLPPGTPQEAEVAVQRLVELTSILARRCAQLQEALESRIVIEQAKGVIAERCRIEPEQAFEALRQAARSNRIALRDVAARVMSSDTTPWELAAQLNGTPVRRRRTNAAGGDSVER
jgi:hypothetical protein